MKIIFSGYHNPHFKTITEYVERAIMALGHSLAVFDDRRFLVPGRIRRSLPLLHHIDLKRINNNLLSLVSRFKPDICIISGGHRILPTTIEKIKKNKAITCLWTIDSPLDFNPIIKTAPSYDFVFCGGTEAMELLKHTGIKNMHWLPFACDPELHKPLKVSLEDKKRYSQDIAFVGSYYPNRERVLEKISDFNVGIWGPGWGKVSLESPLNKCIRKKEGIRPQEWLKIYASSKIVLSIHRQGDNILCNQASPRVYEALACGKFLISDAQKDVLSLFYDKEDLVVFNDIAHLRKLIELYLKHSDLREIIAKNAREKVVKQHTYRHRIKTLLDTVLKQR